MNDRSHTLGYSPSARPVPLLRLDDGTIAREVAIVAEEVPVAFIYNGRAHVVMMATPEDLEDFAVGFSVGEEIVATAAEIERIDVVRFGLGIELQLTVADRAAERLASRTRRLSGRTGCGLCGVEAIGEAVREVRPVSAALPVRARALWKAGATLTARQPINAETHAVHAAAWSTAEGELKLVREDVGRHNAVDQVIGALLREGIEPSHGFMVVTSRASYELVQKCAAVGIPLLAAVSRPTGLAVRMAEMAGLTLVALLRGESANVYAGAERIQAD